MAIDSSLVHGLVVMKREVCLHYKQICFLCNLLYYSWLILTDCLGNSNFTDVCYSSYKLIKDFLIFFFIYKLYNYTIATLAK